MTILMANMRVSDERSGDFNSGLAACRSAERRVGELLGRNGADVLLEACVSTWTAPRRACAPRC